MPELIYRGPHRMFTKLFGLGLSRTGTTSLDQALNRLSIRCIHYPWDDRTYFQLLDGDPNLRVAWWYDAIVDITTVPIYKDLDRIWPGSKFIYTVRSPETWLPSLQAHWARGGRPMCKAAKDVYPISRLLLTKVFGQLDWDAGKFLEAYRRHDADVRAYFAERPNDLLVLDICDRHQGWAELCGFLGLPVPDEPFPHAYKQRGPGEPPTAGFWDGKEPQRPEPD